VHHSTAIVRENNEHIQHSQLDRRHSKEIDRHYLTASFRRNVIQVCVGLLSFFGINRETVRSEISKPSFRNSPCTRGAPHNGFAEAIVRTNLRISPVTGGRPGIFWHES